jgi:hypothetical protein
MCVAGLLAVPLHAQTTTSTDWAWKPVLDLDGVRIHYIFYSEAVSGRRAAEDGTAAAGGAAFYHVERDGVVLKMVNTRKEAIRYSFTLIIKSPLHDFETLVRGEMAPESILTGEAADLFWAPFDPGESIGEIGVRGFKVSRVRT